MNKANIFAGLIAGTLFGFFVNAEMVNNKVESAATQLGAKEAAQVEFDAGKASVNPSEVEDIKEAISAAKKSGKISEVKIFSWADQEYPADGVKAPESSVKLADQRADALKKMLKKNFGVKDVDTYNMAKRPNSLQELLKTGTAKSKDQLEASDAAPTKSEDTGMFGMAGKKSSAVVMVFTE